MFGPKKKELYQPIALGDIKNLSEEEWLKWREHGPHYYNPDKSDLRYLSLAFGGSDVAAILNKSPWTSSLELFHKKISVKPVLKVEYNPISKELGHVYESAISEAFMIYMRINEPKLKIVKITDTTIYRHGKRDKNGELLYPWALGNLDYRVTVNGQDGGLEIKRTSSRNYQSIQEWKAGIVPIYYELQCRYYMAIMNLQFWYICCSWGHAIDEMAVVRVDRDYDIEEAMMASIADFAECVEQGIEPDVNQCIPEVINNYYFRLYGKVSDKAPTIELPASYISLMEKANAVEQEIIFKTKSLEESISKKEEIYSKLYPVFGSSSYGTCRLSDDQVAIIRLKTPLRRAKLDEEKIRQEHPDLYQKYSKTVFDATEFKKEQKKLALDYKLPPEVNTDGDKKNLIEVEFVNRPLKTII